MLFATFKHHQSDFPLKSNDKFACAKLVLKDSPPFYRPSWPIPITINLKTLPALQRAYVFAVIIPNIYTYFVKKIHYLLLSHPTTVIFWK